MAWTRVSLLPLLLLLLLPLLAAMMMAEVGVGGVGELAGVGVGLDLR